MTSPFCDSCGFLPPLPTGTDRLSYLIEILTKADALRGRTATSLVFPMHGAEFDRYSQGLLYPDGNFGGRFLLPADTVCTRPPPGHEGKRGMWLVGVWVERVDN